MAMHIYSYQLLFWSSKNYDETTCREVLSVCEIESASLIEREPSDDSTDPGGIVSLADLGYKTIARNVNVNDIYSHLRPEYPYCYAVYSKANRWAQELHKILSSKMEYLSIDTLCVRFGVHDPFDEHSRDRIRQSPLCGIELKQYPYSVELSGEGSLGENGVVEVITESRFIDKLEAALESVLGMTESGLFVRL